LERVDWIRMLNQAPEEERVDRWLLDHFGGLSPLVCREVVYRACGRVDAWFRELDQERKYGLLNEIERLFSAVNEGQFVPEMIRIDGKLKDFTFVAVKQYEGEAETIPCESFSAMLDQFYAQREQQESVKQRGQDLIRSVTTARDRTARKIANQKLELEKTFDRDRLRQMGDLITSNLYRMEKGMEVLQAENYYEENTLLEIKLDPLLTPQQNAARYYKEYTKAKTAQEMLTIQISKNETELEYLNSVLECILRAEGDRDLQEIRNELMQTGYLRRQGGKGGNKRSLSAPMEFRSSTGLRISVGKNNMQNDLLTCKQAGKQDIWFHTQKIHGAHVILWTQGEQADLTSLNQAACLAAWFSQGRESGKVAVDYTPVRYVKKPAGSRPGMVIYTTYETAYVTPDGELAKRLRVK